MRVSARVWRPLVAIILLGFSVLGFAEPYIIERFAFDGVLGADGAMDVQERIEVLFNEPRRGIFRQIPIHYDTGSGTTRDIFLSKIRVTNDQGETLETKISTEGRYLKIRIGDPDVYLDPGTRQTYIIQYRADGMLNWFDDRQDWEPNAELYWGITGEEWDTQMDKVEFRVRFPKVEGGKGLRARVIYGPYGSRLSHDLLQPKENSYDATTGTVVSLGESELTGARQIMMPAYNGLTVVLSVPAKLIPPPSFMKRTYRFLLPNLGFTIPLWVLMVMAIFWFRYGRDPHTGPTVVQFDPPDDIGGAELGAFLDESVDQRDLAAGIVSLAVKGHLTITPKEEGLIFKKRTADLNLTGKAGEEGLTSFESKLLDKLRACDTPIDESELRRHVAPHVAELKTLIYKDLVRHGYYLHSPESARTGWGCAGIAAILLLGLAFFWISPFHNPLPAIIGGVLGAVVLALFAKGMPRRTDKGARALGLARGFEDFVRRAHKDQLEWMTKKHPDAALFEAYLPHAVAMGLTREWAQSFEGIIHEMPSWYGGTYGPGFHPTYFASDFGSITQTLGTAASVPPRSSGGGGGSSGFSSGGGFSGGGFGGGGGGSW